MIAPLRWFTRAILAPLATVFFVAVATSATPRAGAAQNCISCPDTQAPTISFTPRAQRAQIGAIRASAPSTTEADRD